MKTSQQPMNYSRQILGEYSSDSAKANFVAVGPSETQIQQKVLTQLRTHSNQTRIWKKHGRRRRRLDGGRCCWENRVPPNLEIRS